MHELTTSSLLKLTASSLLKWGDLRSFILDSPYNTNDYQDIIEIFGFINNRPSKMCCKKRMRIDKSNNYFILFQDINQLK